MLFINDSPNGSGSNRVQLAVPGLTGRLAELVVIRFGEDDKSPINRETGQHLEALLRGHFSPENLSRIDGVIFSGVAMCDGQILTAAASVMHQLLPGKPIFSKKNGDNKAKCIFEGDIGETRFSIFEKINLVDASNIANDGQHTGPSGTPYTDKTAKQAERQAEGQTAAAGG